MKSSALFKKLRPLLPRILLLRMPRKIEIVLMTEKRARLLNLVYLRKNSPANVLSFRYGPDYGEILICPALIQREAKKQGNTYKYQMTWMVLHGMIHLAGIHHESSYESTKHVERLERRILQRLAGKNLKFKNKNLK